jgi:hypothetical protein
MERIEFAPGPSNPGAKRANEARDPQGCLVIRVSNKTVAY